MKKTDELKQAINGKRSEVERLQAAEQMEQAAKAAEELNQMVDEYKTAKALEDSALEVFTGGSATPVEDMAAEDKAVLRNRAFNKLVLSKGQASLTDAERSAYFDAIGTPGQVEGTDTKGGYLVPEEQLATIREFRKSYTALKDYCHVVQANSNKGKWPTLGEESGLLVNFEELNDIKESDFEFGQATYEITDYGDIIPVSNQLIADANVNILSIVGQRLARKAVNTENSAILSLLGSLTATAVTGYKGLTKALNVDLDPVYYANARIFTNQDGFQWLSELEDGKQRPLLLPDVAAPDSYRFRGKEIVVIPNSILQTKTGKIPFYIGNLADYAMFFERQGVEIAVSTEYLFAKYGTALRCVVRFGVAKDDVDAIKAYYVSATSGT